MSKKLYGRGFANGVVKSAKIVSLSIIYLSLTLVC